MKSNNPMAPKQLNLKQREKRKQNKIEARIVKTKQNRVTVYISVKHFM